MKLQNYTTTLPGIITEVFFMAVFKRAGKEMAIFFKNRQIIPAINYPRHNNAMIYTIFAQKIPKLFQL